METTASPEKPEIQHICTNIEHVVRSGFCIARFHFDPPLQRSAVDTVFRGITTERGNTSYKAEAEWNDRFAVRFIRYNREVVLEAPFPRIYRDEKEKIHDGRLHADVVRERLWYIIDPLQKTELLSFPPTVFANIDVSQREEGISLGTKTIQDAIYAALLEAMMKERSQEESDSTEWY